MESNAYQWHSDITKYRTSRTDAIAMELHRLGCNVGTKLQLEQGQVPPPPGRTPSSEQGGVPSPSSASNSASTYVPKGAARPPPTHSLQSLRSAHSMQDFTPAPRPPAAPHAHAAPQQQQQQQAFGALPIVQTDAQRMQAEMANFYRLQSPCASPLLAQLRAPTPPPPTPCSPLPPAGVLHCPTPQFPAFASPAPAAAAYEFRSPSPMQQQQHQYHHALQEQQQYQMLQEQQQQQQYQMMADQQQHQYIPYPQYQQLCNACSEELRKRTSWHARVDQRGDIPRRISSKVERSDLLPGHVIWPDVGASRPTEVKEQVSNKGNVKGLVVPAGGALTARRNDFPPPSKPRRKHGRRVPKESLYDSDTDSDSTEFFWDSPDEEIAQRVHGKTKAKENAEDKGKETEKLAHDAAGARRSQRHQSTYRGRELKGRTEEISRALRRHAAGDKRRHDRSDSLDRHVKMRRAEYDPAYHDRHRSHRTYSPDMHSGSHSMDVPRNVLKGRVVKPTGGNTRRHRERAEMGDSPSRVKNVCEEDKKYVPHHVTGGGRRPPKRSEGSPQRTTKQPATEERASDRTDTNYKEPQKNATLIELVGAAAEMQYFERARETEIPQVQQCDMWFNNLPTITEMQHDEESPGSSRHIQQIASNESKKRVHAKKSNLKQNQADVKQEETELQTLSMWGSKDCVPEKETSELDPTGLFSLDELKPSASLTWATGRSTEVYTAHIRSIGETEGRVAQTFLESKDKNQKKITLDKTWPEPLPTLPVAQNVSSNPASKSEALPQTCANEVRGDQHQQTKDVERITIISIQHDKENTVKGTKQLLQATKDDIQAMQQSTRVSAQDDDQHQSDEEHRKLISVSTQRGRSPGKQSKAVGTHGERSRSGSRLRRVQITPIVRFRHVHQVSFTGSQNISSMPETDCKTSKISTDGTQGKTISLVDEQNINKSQNVPSIISGTPSAVMEREKVSEANRQTTNISGSEDAKPSLKSESRTSNKLRSVSSQTTSALVSSSPGINKHPSLVSENKGHSKVDFQTVVTPSISESQSVYATSKVEPRAMHAFQPNLKSFRASSINWLPSVRNESSSKLSDASWQTISAIGTDSQTVNINSQAEFQTSDKPTPICSQTLNHLVSDKDSVNKRPSTAMEPNKKLSKGSWKNINTYPVTEAQTISVPSQSEMRASHMPSSNSQVPKCSFHESESFKKQQSEVLQNSNKHPEPDCQINKEASTSNLQNIGKLSESGPQFTHHSTEAKNCFKQYETIPKERQINETAFIPENEIKCDHAYQSNAGFCDESSGNGIAKTHHAVENSTPSSQKHSQENIPDSCLEREVIRQNIQDIPIPNIERIREDHNEQRQFKITLPPPDTLKSILKSPKRGSENQKKHSGGPQGVRRPPKIPVFTMPPNHNHSTTRPKDDEKLHAQKTSKSEKHKHSKHSERKSKDATQITIHIQQPSKETDSKDKRKKIVDIKKTSRLQRDVSRQDQLPKNANVQYHQRTQITTDERELPNSDNFSEIYQPEAFKHGNTKELSISQVDEVPLCIPKEIRKDVEIATQYSTKSIQPSEKSSHTNSQTASLQRLVKELTAVAKDLHRTVVSDLRRLDNFPQNSTESAEPKPADSNNKEKSRNDTIVEQIETTGEKEIKCIFMSESPGKTDIQYPNGVKSVPQALKSPLDNIRITRKEFSSQTPNHSKLRKNENEPGHFRLKTNTDHARRVREAEITRVKSSHARKTTQKKALLLGDKKLTTKNIKMSKFSGTLEEHTLKSAPGRARNRDNSGINLKNIPRSEHKDAENVRSRPAKVTMRDVQRSTASFTRRFQRRSAAYLQHIQRHNIKDAKILQEVKNLKDKKNTHSKQPVRNTPNILNRPETEITSVLLHSDSKFKPYEESFQTKQLAKETLVGEHQRKQTLSSQHGRQPEVAIKHIPSINFQKWLGDDKEPVRYTSSTHMQHSKLLASNSQRLLSSTTVIQNLQRSPFTSQLEQQAMHLPAVSTVTQRSSLHDARKRSPELVCIKEPPNISSKNEHKSSIFGKRRLQKLVGNGIKKGRNHETMRSKIISNALKLPNDRDQKLLTSGMRNINQHQSTVTERRERILGKSGTQSRQPNHAQKTQQPKTSVALLSRQQTDTSAKKDNESANATPQKLEKPSNVQQHLKEKLDQTPLRSTHRMQQNVRTPNIARQISKRRGVVKARRIQKSSVNTARRNKKAPAEPVRRVYLTPVERAELAELEPPLVIPKALYPTEPGNDSSHVFRISLKRHQDGNLSLTNSQKLQEPLGTDIREKQTPSDTRKRSQHHTITNETLPFRRSNTQIPILNPTPCADTQSGKQPVPRSQAQAAKQHVSDGAMQKVRPSQRTEARRAKKRLFMKRLAKASKGRLRRDSKPSATAANAKGAKTPSSVTQRDTEKSSVASGARSSGKPPFDFTRRLKRPGKRRAKWNRRAVGLTTDTSVSSHETLESPVKTSTPAQAGKQSDVSGRRTSQPADCRGRETKPPAKITVREKRWESKSVTRDGKRSSQSTSRETSSTAGSKHVTPCDSASSLAARKPFLHKMKTALMSPLTYLRPRQAHKSPPCEYLMRPIALRDRTSSHLFNVEDLNVVVD